MYSNIVFLNFPAFFVLNQQMLLNKAFCDTFKQIISKKKYKFKKSLFKKLFPVKNKKIAALFRKKSNNFDTNYYYSRF